MDTEDSRPSQRIWSNVVFRHYTGKVKQILNFTSSYIRASIPSSPLIMRAIIALMKMHLTPLPWQFNDAILGNKISRL